MNDTPTQPAPTRPGIYARGNDTVDAILKSALNVLIQEGATAFSLGRIAAGCGLKVGNVSHYFPRKEMLVQVLLEDLLKSGESTIESTLRKPGLSAEDGLAILIQGTLDDIHLKQTTHLFTELWAMANHNDFVADRVKEVYRYFHGLVGSFVAQLNPALGTDDVETVALFITASMEGTTILSGFGKPWESKMPQMKAMAVKSLVQLAKTITPEEIHQLPAPK